MESIVGCTGGDFLRPLPNPLGWAASRVAFADTSGSQVIVRVALLQ